MICLKLFLLVFILSSVTISIWRSQPYYMNIVQFYEFDYFVQVALVFRKFESTV